MRRVTSVIDSPASASASSLPGPELPVGVAGVVDVEHLALPADERERLAGVVVEQRVDLARPLVAPLEDRLEPVRAGDGLRRDLHAERGHPRPQRDGLRDQFRVRRVQVDRHVVHQHRELAVYVAGVGRPEEHLDGERLVLALPGWRDDLLHQHFVADAVVQREDVDRHVLRGGRGDGGVDVAEVLVPVGDQHQSPHRVVAERRQPEVDRTTDVRPAAALFMDRLGVVVELRAGDRVDPRVVRETDHPHAVVGLLVLVLGRLVEVPVAGDVVGVARVPRELVDRVADVREDDHLDVLVLPLPPRPREDQDETEQHQQAQDDGRPLPHGAEAVHRPNPHGDEEGAEPEEQRHRRQSGEILHLERPDDRERRRGHGGMIMEREFVEK